MDLFIESPGQASGRSVRERTSQDTWLKAMQQQYEQERARAFRAEDGAAKRQGEEAEPHTASVTQASGAVGRPGAGIPWWEKARPAPEAYRTEDAQKNVSADENRRSEPQVRALENTGQLEQASYSIAQESYREELAFDKRRIRRRKLSAALRVAALIVGIPLLLIGVFMGSYVFTCILNGATPGEVATLLQEMAQRVTSFFAQVA